MISRRPWPPLPLLLTTALLAVAALLVACGSSTTTPTAIPTPARFNPTLTAAVSDAAVSANAGITFAVALPAGNDILGTLSLSPPTNAWNIASDTAIPNDSVTAVGTMAVIFKPDGNCTGGIPGIPKVYPFSLLAKTVTAPGVAEWDGIITDFQDTDPGTNWTLNLTVSLGKQPGSYRIDGVMTDALLPPGSTICTPQTFTITFCGRANPSSSATVCGSGANPIVMTNPPIAVTYTWSASLISDGGQIAEPSASVCIGPSCATPAPSPAPTPTPAPTP